MVGDPKHPRHETTLTSRRAYDGRLVSVRVDDVRLPTGRVSTREVVEHPGSVLIIPVTTDNRVLLIRQYRHVIGRETLELPAGLIDPGETPEITAPRELTEETGYAAGSIRILATTYMSPGYAEEQTTFVLAEGCVPVAHTPDPDEPIALVPTPLSDVPALVEPGSIQIVDAQALLGLLWLLRLRGAKG